MTIDWIETPALILDMDICEENIRTMKGFLEEKKYALRPHYKSHKSPYIAHLQIREGAKGICCAKLSEAEDLVFSGIQDVLIANQITDRSKIARLAYLAGCCRLTVCVDRADNVAALEAAAKLQGTTIHCLVEYEVGMNRCGVNTPQEFLALAKQIDASPHLVFDGIQAYAGNLSHEENYENRKLGSEKVERSLRELKEYVEQNGLAVKEISGTSTGTLEFRHQDSVFTEIQAGSYLFMDAAYNALKLKFKSALFLLTQVISINSNWVIVDGGMKSISVDQYKPVFRDYPDLPVRVSEEHSKMPNPGGVKMGDRLMMIPGHCCTTFNLHNYCYLVHNGKVVDRIPIISRGKST